MPADLAAYLRARWDEEERDAYEADARQWTAGPDGEILLIASPEHAGPGVGVVATVTLTVNPAFAAEDAARHGRQSHIVRWSPARVLADIAAKRAVLDLYELSLAETRAERDWAFLEAPVPPMPTRTLPLGSTRGLELAVQALAQAYATRPDFDPSWRTDA